MDMNYLPLGLPKLLKYLPLLYLLETLCGCHHVA